MIHKEIPSVTNKKRHGCLISWLIVMTVLSSVISSVYLFVGLFIVPVWYFPAQIMLFLLNIVCAVALFRWKKWGFWGLFLSAVIAIAISIAVGFGIEAALAGIVSAIIIYVILKLGKENGGWSQLE